MKKYCLILVLILSTGCGSFTVSPHLCKSQGLWSNEDKELNEFYVSEDYYLGWGNEEVRTKDIISKININCEQIKTLRIKIHSSFFIKRTVEIYYTLN